MAKKKAIVFIDGNNFYHNLKASWINPGKIDFKKLVEYICNHFSCEYVKTIYYNSVPDITQDEDKYYKHMEFLEKLKKIPNFEVKTRKLQRHSTKEKIKIVEEELSHLGLCKKCEPIVKVHWKDYIGSVSEKEKGIDVMIAIDMIRQGIIDNKCNTCILVSGDADFIPSMDLLKEKGKSIVSTSLVKGYSFNLRQKHGWFILDKQNLKDNCFKDK